MSKRKQSSLSQNGEIVLDDDSRKRAKRTNSTKSTKNESAITKLNSLRPKEFHPRFMQAPMSTLGGSDDPFHATFKFARDLHEAERDACFSLIDLTSRADYERSSWGWHPKRKKREMSEDEMRYVLLHKAVSAQSVGMSSSPQLTGFISFMLTHDSIPAVPVLYIYEIHLVEAARGTGVGSRMMRLAEQVARAVKVDKVMLTCFLGNATALKFYQRLGYDVDVSSPEDRKTRGKVVKADYVILSKDVG